MRRFHFAAALPHRHGPVQFVETDRPPSEPTWRALHRIADALAPEFGQAFLLHMGRLNGDVSLRALTAAVEAGDVGAALRAIPLGQFEAGLREALEGLSAEGMARGAEAVRPSLPTAQARSEAIFNRANPRAVAWAREHAAELVREISDDVRDAIRQGIVRELESGRLGPRRIAQLVRERVGLTSRQERAIANYRIRLERAEIGPGVIDDLASKYRDRALRYRAETIARTESIEAAAEGQREIWRQTVDDGLIDSGEWERVWIVTPDDRLCLICRPLQGLRAPIGGVYPGGLKGPTRHPRCRCAEALVKKGAERRQRTPPPFDPGDRRGLAPRVPKAAPATTN